PTSAPLLIDVSRSPTTIGSVRRPDTVADTPSTNCMNVGKNVSAPSIAKPTTKDSTQHTLNTGFLNTLSGSTGSTARRSTVTKITSATADPTKSAMITGEFHGYVLPPQLVASVRPVAPMPT